jgi:hypothetical protein
VDSLVGNDEWQAGSRRRDLNHVVLYRTNVFAVRESRMRLCLYLIRISLAHNLRSSREKRETVGNMYDSKPNQSKRREGQDSKMAAAFSRKSRRNSKISKASGYPNQNPATGIVSLATANRQIPVPRYSQQSNFKSSG